MSAGKDAPTERLKDPTYPLVLNALIWVLYYLLAANDQKLKQLEQEVTAPFSFFPVI